VNQGLAFALLVAAFLESGIIGLSALRQRHLGRLTSTLDFVFGLIGLVVISTCIRPDELSTTVNWMQPYTVGTLFCIALGLRWPLGTAAAVVLATTYAGAAFAGPISFTSGRLTAVIANACVYPAFIGVFYVIVGLARLGTRRIDEARALALRQAGRRAAEDERERQRRIMHDDPLQILELIASGKLIEMGGPERQRREADEAAVRLAAGALAAAGASSLPDAIAAAVDGAVARGLRVNLSLDPAIQRASPDVVAAIKGAVVEALNNVGRHSGARTAQISGVIQGEALVITVADEGAGFDMSRGRSGFGLASMAQRLKEVGGRVEVDSQPGAGTRIRVRVPR
jgi:signal transduction histidine kinase